MGKIRIILAIVLTATILSACSYERKISGNAQEVTNSPQTQKSEENADKQEEITEEQKVNSEDTTKETVKDKPATEKKGSAETAAKPITVTNPSDITVVVNKRRSLSVNWKPDDLVQVSVPYRGRTEAGYMRKEASAALEKLFSAAKSQGIDICAVSGFRSYKLQQTVFANHVSNMGEAKARKISAYPGQSEHQTGLAMDISSASLKYGLSESFGNTVEGKWLRENAAEYGFIIRYLKGKESITGYSYEPWHIRYVGTDISKEIMKRNMTLEEYLNIKN